MKTKRNETFGRHGMLKLKYHLKYRLLLYRGKVNLYYFENQYKLIEIVGYNEGTS